MSFRRTRASRQQGEPIFTSKVQLHLDPGLAGSMTKGHLGRSRRSTARTNFNQSINQSIKKKRYYNIDDDEDKNGETEETTTQPGDITEVHSDVKPGAERMSRKIVEVEEVKLVVEPSSKAVIVKSLKRIQATEPTLTHRVLSEFKFSRDCRVVSQNLHATCEKGADRTTSSAAGNKTTAHGNYTVDNKGTDSKGQDMMILV